MKTLIVSLLLLVQGFLPSATAAPDPNVVILLTDDQGTLDAGCYGSADLKTPNIDRLAVEGVRFTQAYAHTVCCPSRAALFTGRHPQRGGVRFWTQGDRHGSDSRDLHLAKGTFLEGGIRVPTIIRYPAKIPAGQTRDQIVTIMDWFSTVLDLCGITQPSAAPKLDGHSMGPILTAPKTPSANEVLHFAWGKNWAVRRGDWKLIATHNVKASSPRLALHHLAEPAPEVRDHAQEQPQLVRELTALHETWEHGLIDP